MEEYKKKLMVYKLRSLCVVFCWWLFLKGAAEEKEDNDDCQSHVDWGAMSQNLQNSLARSLSGYSVN